MLTSLASALVAPRAAEAQRATNIPGVGFLSPSSLSDSRTKATSRSPQGVQGGAPHALQVRHAQDTARALGLGLHVLGARDPSDIEKAFAVMAKEQTNAASASRMNVVISHQAGRCGSGWATMRYSGVRQERGAVAKW